jgi:hypothetical protein
MGRKRHGFLAVGIAGLTALGAAGCGGGDDGGSGTSSAAAQAPAARARAATTPATTTPAPAATTPAPASSGATVPASDPLAKAAAVAAKATGGVAITLTGTVTADKGPAPLTGKGTVDRRSGKGHFDIRTGAAGSALTIREVMDGRSVYLTNKLFTNRLPGKRSWMKIDLRKAAKTSGFDLSALGTNGPSQDPTLVLSYLHGAGPAKELGTATINGTKTTHYSAAVDLDKAKAAASSSAGKAAIAQLISTLGDPTAKVPVEVWLDAQHRVVRERVHYTATVNKVSTKLDFTTTFRDTGKPVKVDVPPAADTVDGLKLITQGASGTPSSS